MRAWVLYGPGDLRFEDRPVPTPGPGEALVKVRAAGICGSDIPRIFTTGAHVHPLIPGHEFAGEVAECPEEPSLVGRAVGIFPLLPCKTCPQCRLRRYEMCQRYGYLGSRNDGGFADYVRVPIWNLLPLPEGLSLEEAACLEPLSVAIHAIRRADITPEDSVTVIGLGTIGLFALMALSALGVRDLAAVGNKPFQREMAASLGIGGARYTESGVPRPADAVLECVGRAETASLALEAAGPGGRVVLVGNPHSDMTFPRDQYWQILRKQLAVLGTWNSSYFGYPPPSQKDDWHRALDLLSGGKLDLRRAVTHRFPLAELDRGLAILRDRTENAVKIMAVMD